MYDNTPPRAEDIEESLEEVVLVHDGEPPPDDDSEASSDRDDLEMEEVTLEELEARFASEESSNIPIQDDSAFTFTEHRAPIFCCDLHPHQELAVTGGGDDNAYLWDINTGHIWQIIDFHRDSVVEVHFSYDHMYLASGDMAGNLVLHKVVERIHDGKPIITLNEIWDYSMGDMSWLKWHRASHVLLAGSVSGEVYMWRMPSGDCKILPGDGARCEKGELTNDGKKLFTAYVNGVLKLWDLKTCKVLMEVNGSHAMAHHGNIPTLACDKDSPLYMSGGEDGKILFCTNNGPVAYVSADGSVECVAFSPCSDLKMAASGTLTGQIAIWDVSKFSLRLLCEHPEMDDGIVMLKWISNFTLLVTTIQGNIFGYDARSGTRKFTLYGHRGEVYDFHYSPIDNILLTVCEDNTAKIFKIPPLDD